VGEETVILIWGLAGDGPVASVRRALERNRATVAFVDQHALLASSIEVTCGGHVGGSIRTGGRQFGLDDVSAAYLRPYDPRRVLDAHGVEADSVRWHLALSVEDALSCWSEMTRSFVVNRPSAMASNNSKPYQATLIQRHGMQVPETLITTDVGAVAEFRARHGRIIYKSMSGIRSIVSQLRDDDIHRLRDIANCPIQFQEYVEGIDVRVHVIGDETFACEIRSEADDYRYPDRQHASIEITECTLPTEVRELCHSLAAALDLPVAGIDLRRTPADEWYCFEVNPSPGFTFYEEATGQPISDATARLLASGGERRTA
jgi:predicted ATP-grasp superfamily ATP-dependent carboligase